MIEIINLYKSFEGQKVLRGVNLKISSGELIAIIGESGGGKSVLLRHLIGLLRPEEGKVVVEGEDITVLNRREMDRIREKFGVVFQGGALFDSFTVFDNIAFPLREKTKLPEEKIREKVEEALEDVGLLGVEEKYPAELSGGMRKRVSLARALITEPKIVLFDEPTTGLDPIKLHAIHKLIVDTHNKYGFTGVMISHDIPEIYEVVDRIAFLYEGKIEVVGTPEEIVHSKDRIVTQFITGSLSGPIKMAHVS
ncbi:MAG TPA: ABC transporter ATP-binding protein [Thermodesulfovibrionales bacterium]|nr:ABC transporter ATP-binding protein [Thermodesulfovibrionales bacterium]